MLLGSIKDGHLNTCKITRDGADTVCPVIDMFIPRFLKSKVVISCIQACFTYIL